MTKSEFGKIVRQRWVELGFANAETGDLIKLVANLSTPSSAMCKAIADVVMNGLEPDVTLVFDQVNRTFSVQKKTCGAFLGSSNLPWDSDWD